MVFEDLDNEDLKSKRHLIPLVTSLMLHAVLAFILWSLVFGIESAKSIRLTASLSTPSSTVSLKVRETVQPVSPVTVDGDQPAMVLPSVLLGRFQKCLDAQMHVHARLPETAKRLRLLAIHVRTLCVNADDAFLGRRR